MKTLGQLMRAESGVEDIRRTRFTRYTVRNRAYGEPHRATLSLAQGDVLAPDGATVRVTAAAGVGRSETGRLQPRAPRVVDSRLHPRHLREMTAY